MVNIRINATGCSLIDTIINGVDFHSNAIKSYLSNRKGDGGLTPGELVFKEALESFSGKTLEEIITVLKLNHCSVKKNIGGPAIVALISTAQILYHRNISFRFFQNYGDDENGRYLVENLEKFAPKINRDFYTQVVGHTAETLVLSDPSYHNDQGERTFINTLGVAGDFHSGLLDDRFFDGDILLYGATALTPLIHEGLTEFLCRGKKDGKINIVTTVFDFLNEKKSPNEPWPLGRSPESYSYIDLLITDQIESLRLSGKTTIEEAIEQFRQWNLKALVITNGAEPVTYYVAETSSIFKVSELQTLRASDLLSLKFNLSNIPEGDTTGCGDNFAGGLLASIVNQILDNCNEFDLREAITWGNCTGASACFHLGGMMREKKPGEKLMLVEQILKQYRMSL